MAKPRKKNPDRKLFPLTVYLDERTDWHLREISERDGTPMSVIVRAGLGHVLRRDRDAEVERIAEGLAEIERQLGGGS